MVLYVVILRGFEGQFILYCERKYYKYWGYVYLFEGVGCIVDPVIMGCYYYYCDCVGVCLGYKLGMFYGFEDKGDVRNVCEAIANPMAGVDWTERSLDYVSVMWKVILCEICVACKWA